MVLPFGRSSMMIASQPLDPTRKRGGWASSPSPTQLGPISWTSNGTPEANSKVSATSPKNLPEARIPRKTKLNQCVMQLNQVKSWAISCCNRQFSLSTKNGASLLQSRALETLRTKADCRRLGASPGLCPGAQGKSPGRI